ncbi:FAD-binding protein [Peribacillus saganii]|uniref:FAD-binding protein n=1 Tax=Peribacillus saganii TaxID=2303992 RepID=A0A372LAQ9_9BACI|nr:FAD-linked oxidase C-terminal domain-containing protein [Peribacillus saganii]RFU62798.1 FAD-binding protein [Peribacillus saganii]
MTYRKIDFELLRAIYEIIPDKSRVLTEKHDLISYSFDASFGSFEPEVIVQPLLTEEISYIVKFANQYTIPIYPRGQSTSLSGGPLPVNGGIVLDLSRMTHRLEVYPDDLIAVVSPGVLTGDIHKAAEQYGLMYPPDPSSSAVCTIGGNLAENSGGPRGLKYGVTKDYVLGLTVVTPSGDIVRTGGKTIKNVTGYDLTKLIVGSEGTLGIISEAVLKLVPKPKSSETLLAAFNEIETAGAAVSKILTSGILPSKLEILDKGCIHSVEAYEPSGLPLDAEAVLLIEVDGHPSATKEEIIEVAEKCKEIGAASIKIAESNEEKNQLWKARKLISPAITRIKPTKISEDATVPLSQIPEMFKRLKEIRDKFQVSLVVCGHAGDGNLHPNIVADIRDQDEMERAEKAVEEIFRCAVELGGTLSGEHGIGIMKAPFMEMELGKEGLHLMKVIKEAWDPNNIMNPGKIFPYTAQGLLFRR